MQRQKRPSGAITANQVHPGNDKTLSFAQSAVDFIKKPRKDSSDVISCVVEDDTAQQSMATAAKTYNTRPTTAGRAPLAPARRNNTLSGTLTVSGV